MIRSCFIALIISFSALADEPSAISALNIAFNAEISAAYEQRLRSTWTALEALHLEIDANRLLRFDHLYAESLAQLATSCDLLKDDIHDYGQYVGTSSTRFHTLCNLPGQLPAANLQRSYRGWLNRLATLATPQNRAGQWLKIASKIPSNRLSDLSPKAMTCLERFFAHGIKQSHAMPIESYTGKTGILGVLGICQELSEPLLAPILTDGAAPIYHLALSALQVNGAKIDLGKPLRQALNCQELRNSYQAMASHYDNILQGYSAEMLSEEALAIHHLAAPDEELILQLEWRSPIVLQGLRARAALSTTYSAPAALSEGELTLDADSFHLSVPLSRGELCSTGIKLLGIAGIETDSGTLAHTHLHAHLTGI